MKFKLILLISLMVLIAGCNGTAPAADGDHAHEPGTPEDHHDEDTGTDDSTLEDNGDPETPQDTNGAEIPALSTWFFNELNDVNSGETFSINGFKGKTVILESFAVWCPTCTAQQNIVKGMRATESDDVIHISLDTDPSESGERVREHTQEYGFDWIYAVAPTEMTNSLIDDFGFVIVSAPSVPMIIICPDQSTTLLRTGLKQANELTAAVEACA